MKNFVISLKPPGVQEPNSGVTVSTLTFLVYKNVLKILLHAHHADCSLQSS